MEAPWNLELTMCSFAAQFNDSNHAIVLLQPVINSVQSSAAGGITKIMSLLNAGTVQ